MNLSDNEKRAVLEVLRLYRSWMYHTVKEGEDHLDNGGKTYLVKSLATLSSAQKKILESLNTSAMPAKNLKDGASAKSGSNSIAANELSVLIADDDEMSLELIRSLLEDAGIEQICTAENGQQALDQLSNTDQHFHLVISDWKMPELTGLEVHQKASEQGFLEGTTFVLLTGIDDEVLFERAKKQGVNEWITKPIEIEELDKMLVKNFNIEK